MSDKVAVDVERAEALEEQGNWDQAVEVWSRLSQGRSAEKFLLRHGRALARAGRVEEAEAMLRRAIEAAPDEANGYFQLGMLLEDEDRLAEAKEVLERGLFRRESQPILTILGGILLDLGETQAAEKILTHSLSLKAEDDEAHFGIGYAIKDRDPQRALLHFREAIRIDPDSPKAHRELGRLLWHLQDLSEAEREMREATTREPNDAWAHDYLGHLLSFKKDFEGARGEFAKAAELDPSKDVFWCDLAQALSWLDRNDEANGAFRHALSLDVIEPYTLLKYGLFLKRMGEFEKARQYLRRVLDQDPSEKRASKALEEISAKQK